MGAQKYEIVFTILSVPLNIIYAGFFSTYPWLIPCFLNSTETSRTSSNKVFYNP